MTLESITRKQKIVGGGLILFVLLVLPLYGSSNVTTQEIVFPANATVVEPESNASLGVDAGNNLDFGRTFTESNVTKTLNISAPQKSLITVTANGSIAQYLIYDDSHYFEGTRQIEIELRTGTATGNFSGYVMFNAEVPENRIGSRWLGIKSLAY